MKHFDPQLDCSTAPESRDLDRACIDMRPASRRLSSIETCFLIVSILVMHWLGMQWFVTWLGDEEAWVHSQAEQTSDPMPVELSSQVVDDGWRRTAKGWEYLPAHNKTAPQISLPTNHVSPSQLWPAAAAACMLLLIVGLPDKKAAPGA